MHCVRFTSLLESSNLDLSVFRCFNVFSSSPVPQSGVVRRAFGFLKFWNFWYTNSAREFDSGVKRNSLGTDDGPDLLALVPGGTTVIRARGLRVSISFCPAGNVQQPSER
jgi:hypothetical protein